MSSGRWKTLAASWSGLPLVHIHLCTAGAASTYTFLQIDHKQLVLHGPVAGQSFAATPYAVHTYLPSYWSFSYYIIQMDFNFIVEVDNIMHLRHEV